MVPAFQVSEDYVKLLSCAPSLSCVSHQSKPVPAVRRKWTPHEDQRLLLTVTELGESNWAAVSSRLGTRSARQCRERFHNYLSPSLRHDPWSPVEDELLVEKYVECGSRWAQIALFFSGRSEANVKNRWAQLTMKSGKEQLREMERQELIHGLTRIIARSGQEDKQEPKAGEELSSEEMFMRSDSMWEAGQGSLDFCGFFDDQ